MVESQSRYGILDELSKRQIEANKHLAALENGLRVETRVRSKRIEGLELNVERADATYKKDHTNWKTAKQYELDTTVVEFKTRQNLEKAKHESLVSDIRKEITTREKNYEKDHKESTKVAEDAIKEAKEGLGTFKEDQAAGIKQQENIIAEIEKGIKSIKDISKDQA